MRISPALTASSGKDPAALGPLRWILSVPCALLIFQRAAPRVKLGTQETKRQQFFSSRKESEQGLKVCSCWHRAAGLQYFWPALHEELTAVQTPVYRWWKQMDRWSLSPCLVITFKMLLGFLLFYCWPYRKWYWLLLPHTLPLQIGGSCLSQLKNKLFQNHRIIKVKKVI